MYHKRLMQAPVAAHSSIRTDDAGSSARRARPVKAMKTLFDLIQPIPAERTAIILPESNIRVSYGPSGTRSRHWPKRWRAPGSGAAIASASRCRTGFRWWCRFSPRRWPAPRRRSIPGYKEEEFRFYLEDTDARVLILPPDGLEDARRAAGDAVPDSPDRHGRRRARRPRRASPARRPYAAARSRTTWRWCCTPAAAPGGRNACRSTHANLAISARQRRAQLRPRPRGRGDVRHAAVPRARARGVDARHARRPAARWWCPRKFNPLSFWRVARDYGVTWYSAVPTIHQLLLARADPAAGRPAGAETLRFIRSCSAALPPQVMHDLEEAFGAPVLEAYGMTEAAHQMASNPLPPAARKPGSVGPGTDVQISIMDADGQHLPTGEHGEVVIKGPNVTRGYENNPEANAKSFTDGWFRTGDQGFLDSDGYLTLSARIKELINRGGEKISPREIDEVLLAHPAVAEAVCFGVPHTTWGEEVAAAVVRESAGQRSRAARLLQGAAGRVQAPEADSHHDTIPRTATGKIQRGVVAQAFAPQGR